MVRAAGWLGAGALAVAGVVLLAGVSAQRVHAGAMAGSCPRRVIDRPATIAEIITTAQRLLIVGHFASVQGHRYRLSIKANPIIGVIELQPIPPGMNAPDARAYRSIAARRCGAAIASRSWAIVYKYPQTIMASESVTVAFLVLTPRGWRAY